MNEFKNVIRNAPNDKLYAFLTIYNELLRQIPSNSPARGIFNQMIECIEYEMKKRGLSNNRSYVSDSMKREAFNYLKSNGINIENNINRYESEKENSFFEGFAGFCMLFLVLIVIALVKMLIDGVVTLWNNGILKIILGLFITGGVTYIGYKNGLFEKIKRKIINNNKSNNINRNQKTNVKRNSKNNENVKEVIKNLTIFTSTFVITSVGLAHMDKYSDILDDTFLEDSAKGWHCIHEDVFRLIREKHFELVNDYSEFENHGYMNQIDTSYPYEYDENDIYFEVMDNNTSWDALSNLYYGNSVYAHHLQLYNAYYDFSSELISKGTIIRIPNPDKLEEYIGQKKLIKK